MPEHLLAAWIVWTCFMALPVAWLLLAAIICGDHEDDAEVPRGA